MLNTTSTLAQEIHKRIGMLPDDMLEKATHRIFQVPEYPEDFASDDVETFELAKEKFRNGELTGPDDSEAANWKAPKSDTASTVTRDNLHRLAGYMSTALLDECVHVLGSTALLCIPVEPTEEEVRILAETEEEFERGEFFTWEDIKRTDV